MQPQQQDVNVLNDLLCPLTGILMSDPVLTVDGYSFQRKTIQQWFRRGNWRNPLTNNRLGNRVIVPNITLKRLIENYLKKEPNVKKKQIQKSLYQPILQRIQENYRTQLQQKSLKEKSKIFTQDMEMFKKYFQIKKKQFNKKIQFQSGTYEGQLIDNIPNGLGIYQYSDGNRYEGSFIDGIKQGKGITYYHNGIIFQGQYKKGQAFGNGIQISLDGSRYIGQFKGFLKNGKGILYKNDGKVVQENWKQGLKK